MILPECPQVYSCCWALEENKHKEAGRGSWSGLPLQTGRRYGVCVWGGGLLEALLGCREGSEDTLPKLSPEKKAGRQLNRLPAEEQAAAALSSQAAT